MTEAATTEVPEVVVEATTTPDAPSFSVPEEYAESAWAKGLDSNEALWKKLGGSQKLIGDRGAFIPQEGATNEDIEAFIGKLDPLNEQLKSKFAPQAPESYEFGDLELPEGVTIGDEITTKFGEIAKANGLTNEQADNVRKEWINHELEAKANAGTQLNEQFEGMAKELWGDSWADVTAEASEVLKNNVPENMRQAMANMPNEYLVPLVATMKNLSSDKQPDGAPNESGGQVLSADEARAKYRELREKAIKDPRAKQDFHDFNDKHRHLINKK